MRNLFLLLVAFSFVKATYSQNNIGVSNCSEVIPLCLDTHYQCVVDTTPETQFNYDCLATHPNPSWFYFGISQPGDIYLKLQSDSSVDVDFIIWGPFNYPNCDDSLINNNVVDCSFSSDYIEYPAIINAQVGEIYMMMISNFASVQNSFVVVNSSGTGATDCSVVSDITKNLYTNDIEVYPIPSKEYLYVDIKNSIKSKAEIINIYGRKIDEIELTTEISKINIQNLENGVYFIKIKTQTSEITKKFVVL